MNFNSPIAQQPVVTVSSGNQYVVTFNSGAQITVFDENYYLNIYATAPGIDWNRTEGMCGNNNGNPNDDAPGSTISYASQLFPGMVPTTDLWAWKLTSTVTASTLPPYAAECAYVAPVVSKPVISAGSALL